MDEGATARGGDREKVPSRKGSRHLSAGPFPLDAMQRHSPLSYADRIKTPTLIFHSPDDRRCPLPMGRMFYQSLVSRGAPTAMVVYPDEGHGIRQPRHQAVVLRRVLAWFAEHGGEPVAP